MTTYSVDSAAPLLGITLAQLHDLIRAGIVDVRGTEGAPLSRSNLAPGAWVPSWVVDELLENRLT